MLMDGLISLIEALVNKALQHDPRAQQRLCEHQGKVLAIEIVDWHLLLSVVIGHDQLMIAKDSLTKADVSISGDLNALMRLLTSDNKTGSSVTITGDLYLAQAMTTILAGLDIDWEGMLAHYTGDVCAHELSNLGRGIRQFGQRLREKCRRDLGAMIREEAALAPSRQAVEDFCGQVDEIRLRVDRLMARWQSKQPV